MTTLQKPDHEIEQFWLSFKRSMANFYESNKIIPRPVADWSAKLNKYQALQNYTAIEKAILNYISLYGVDVIRLNNTYYMRILMTNLKRWDAIAMKYKFYATPETKNLVIVLLEIMSSITRGKAKTDTPPYNTLFNDIELYLIYEEFDQLIEFAVEHNKPVIIDKLMGYDLHNTVRTLNTLYNQDMPYIPCQGKKIIKHIQTALATPSPSPTSSPEASPGPSS